MARLMRGAPVAKALVEEVAGRASALASAGVVPKLAVVRVGAREADLSYERGIEKRCAACGIELEHVLLGDRCTSAELVSAIERVGEDATVHGCLLMRPLPEGLDEAAACAAIAPEKDVDCATAASLLGVFEGRAVGFPPCTAEAVMQVLRHYGVALAGADACVVGRSLVIGRPVSMMLMGADATVTTCHSRTRDLAAHCRAADVVVVAAGHAGTFDASCAAPGQVVVDVGINWDEEAGRLVGDVDFGAVEPVVGAITPVPGGVGAVTTACLSMHVVEAAERSVGR